MPVPGPDTPPRRGERAHLAAAGTLLGLAAMVVACSGSAASGGAASAGAVDDARARIGIVRSFVDPHHEAFVDEMRVLGWQPGGTLELRPHLATEVPDDLDTARRLLRSWHEEEPLDLVIAFSTSHAELALAETDDVPILIVVNDPVTSGLVQDRRRPEGRLTGVSFRTPADRTLDLADRSMGGIDHLGYLWPAEDADAVAPHRDDVVRVAEAAGVRIDTRAYDGPDDIGAAVEDLASAGVDAVWLANSNAIIRDVDELEDHLVAHRLPTLANTEHPAFAALIVAPDGQELRRQLGRQAARLLAGTPVSSVPFEDPRRFVVIINRTQLAGFDLPEVDAALLRQADVVR